MQLVKPLIGLVSVVLVAGCGTSRVASVAGACEGRPRADVTMFGKDSKSQAFLDETIEDNVARCLHARPSARPDPGALVAQKAPIVNTKAKKERKKWRDYFKRKQATT